MTSRRYATVAAIICFVGGAPAHAQPRLSSTGSHPTPGRAHGVGVEVTPKVGADLRGRFGLDMANSLLRSLDADDRLRGIERAASIHTPDALALLERAAAARSPAAGDPRSTSEGIARTDPRALLAVVRALAGWIDRDSARAALGALLDAAPSSLLVHDPTVPRPARSDDADDAARVLLARQEAAVALADSGSAVAIEALVAFGRGGGSGQAAALEALSLVPPTAPLVLGGVALTTPGMVALAARVGDLRALDSVLGAVRASDPSLRAAAVAALGLAGDSRALDLARTAIHDGDPRVRLAGADALVHLGAPDAAGAVAALVTDDATAAGALTLAREVQNPIVVQAAAARVAVSADREIRAAAVSALGQQADPLAVRVLSTLFSDPALQSDVAYALARSNCPDALTVLASLAATQSTRRLALRAYFVHRFLRGERRPDLDARLLQMGASSDPRDRAVAAQALVALGEEPLATALADPDARARRGAAMGAFPRIDASTARILLDRMSVEQDETTRHVLTAGLLGGDPGGVVATSTLAALASEGGLDAALAAFALARRADSRIPSAIDPFLGSRDPVLRAQAVRGLAASGEPDAVGRLADAYVWEGQVGVRRAVVDALARRPQDLRSATARRTLELGAHLDPDRWVRWASKRALHGEPVAAPSAVREVAWIHREPAPDATLPADARGLLLDADGTPLPIAFDEDGYALVPGVSPGDARLRLAPGLPVDRAVVP